MEAILDFLLRMIVGTLAMFLINSLLESVGLFGVVGVNGTTVLTCGILGFPGLAALYIFEFYKRL